jgi:FMN phosphatase YigB (HAD superfamily)
MFEARRHARGFADYLGTLEDCHEGDPRDQRLVALSFFLLEYPFERLLYPGALDVLARLRRAGPTAIFSDGDGVFQPWKIARSHIAGAVEGRVFVFLHKERELDEMERRVPAERYVVIDDKEWLLAAIKRAWGERVTTVFPRQGHYARDESRFEEPLPDVTVDRIGDLRLADVERAAGGTRP